MRSDRSWERVDTPLRPRRDDGYYSLVHKDDAAAEDDPDDLYEYDADGCFFKRRQLLRPTIKPEPVTPRPFYVPLPDGNYAMTAYG